MKQLKFALAILMVVQTTYGQINQPVGSARTTSPLPTSRTQLLPAPQVNIQNTFPNFGYDIEKRQNEARTAQAETRKKIQFKQNELLKKLIDGPGSTGGGNINSMAVLVMIKSLKDVLLAKGLHNFPEIASNWERFIEKINSRILIEEKHPIVINGEEKEAEFDISSNTIRFSVPRLALLMEQPNALIRVQSLLLHEVLGLMGLEGNADYNISYRMLGLAILEDLGANGSKNQIYPNDPRDAQVIYWSVNPDGRLTFVYCKNRDRTNTCQQLGNRSYTQKELLDAYLPMATYYKKNFKIADGSRRLSYLGSLVLVVLAIILGGVFALPVGASLSAAALFTFFGFTSVAVIYGTKSDKFQEMVKTSEQITHLKPGSTSMNLEEMARGIHKFLSSVDAASKKTGMP